MLNQLLEHLEAKIDSAKTLRLKKQYEDALKAALYRREIEHFSDEKNIYELKFSIEYIENPPIKTERKV